MNTQQSTAEIFAVVGLAGALWSASGYIGAFMRASNAIFDVDGVLPAMLGREMGP